MRYVTAALGLLTSMAVAGAALAQVPPEIAAKAKASAGQISFDVARMYPPLKEPYAGVDVTRDQAFGADPAQKLDVFVPQAKAARRPVLIVVHGGGFVRGDKRNTDNIALWGANKGMVGISVNYRLAPGAPWPAGTDDLKAAIAWTRTNIARFGGDPNHIFLWGHSAGANHVADYVAHTERQGAEAAGIKGAVIMSAFYAPAVGAQPNAYYGADASVQTLSASIDRMVKTRIPLFVINAEYDPDGFRAYSEALDAALTKAKITHARLVAKDHGHLDEGLAIGTADVAVSDPVLKFLQSY